MPGAAVGGAAASFERGQRMPEREMPKSWPEPIGDRPAMEDMKAWEEEGGCEATDGCWVEPDGVCQHGYPSWLLYLGLI